ncbi:MAG: methylenetetrahydrofolate reductase [Muribaculaceae bacterium]|nr:methylenetetrahydrofolate reductase [Muribaculaceae bacterium]
MRCTSDAEVRALGIEWAAAQARELREKGVPSIHFYSMHAVQSVAEIARRIY